MKPRTKWTLLVIGCICLGAWILRRGLENVLVGLGVPTATNPGHARMPPVVVGPYNLEATLTQEPVLVWGDPVKGTSKLTPGLLKAQSLKAQTLKEQGGDGGKAVETLMGRRQEPDVAQALYQAMVELASGQVAGPREGAVPLAPGKEKAETPDRPYAAPEGRSGIAVVAGIAKTLAPKIGQKEMSPFDQVLFEHAIRLMGHHGAPQNAPASVAPGQVPPPAPIDSEVRATLRGFLGNRNTQVFAAKALGALGDMETAVEIVRYPGRYPDASISDFGPQALERYKIARKQAMAQGRGGGEGAFFQSLRIPPQHQDTAIELAMAGDGGASMAMERNWVVLDGMEKDLDTVWAKGLDAWLRFPGSRTAFAEGNRAIMGFFNAPGAGPKTYAMMLKLIEYDLRVVFSGNAWTDRDLRLLSVYPGIFNGLWHYVHIGGAGANQADTALERQLESLFKRLYKPETHVGQGGSALVWELAVYATHLKLKPLKYTGKNYDIFRLKREIKREPWITNDRQRVMEKVRVYSGAGTRYQIWGERVHLCIGLGEIKSVDDL